MNRPCHGFRRLFNLDALQVEHTHRYLYFFCLFVCFYLFCFVLFFCLLALQHFNVYFYHLLPVQGLHLKQEYWTQFMDFILAYLASVFSHSEQSVIAKNLRAHFTQNLKNYRDSAVRGDRQIELHVTE